MIRTPRLLENIIEKSKVRKHSNMHQCLHFSKELRWLEDRVN